MSEPIDYKRVYIQTRPEGTPLLMLGGVCVGEISFSETESTDSMSVDAVVNGAVKEVFLLKRDLERVLGGYYKDIVIISEKKARTEKINRCVKTRFSGNRFLPELSIYEFDCKKLMEGYSSDRDILEFRANFEKIHSIDYLVFLQKNLDSLRRGCYADASLTIIARLIHCANKEGDFDILESFPNCGLILEKMISLNLFSHIPERFFGRERALAILEFDGNLFDKLPIHFQHDKEFQRLYLSEITREIKRGVFEQYAVVEEFRHHPEVIAALKEQLIERFKKNKCRFFKIPLEFQEDREIINAFCKITLEKWESTDDFHDLPLFIKEKKEFRKAYMTSLISNFRVFKQIDSKDIAELTDHEDLLTQFKSEAIPLISSDANFFFRLPLICKKDSRILSIFKDAALRDFATNWRLLHQAIDSLPDSETGPLTKLCIKLISKEISKGRFLLGDLHGLSKTISSHPEIEKNKIFLVKNEVAKLRDPSREEIDWLSLEYLGGKELSELLVEEINLGAPLSTIPHRLRSDDIYLASIQHQPNILLQIPSYILKRLFSRNGIAFQALLTLHKEGGISKAELVDFLPIGFNATRDSSLEPSQELLIESIRDYRNAEIQFNLMYHYCFAEINWDFYNTNIQGAFWADLFLMMLSSHPNRAEAKEVFDKLKLFRSDIKSKQTKLMQSLLSYLTSDMPVSVLRNCLADLDKTSGKEFKMRLNLLRCLQKMGLPIPDFPSLEHIGLELFNHLIRTGFIESGEDDFKFHRFMATFMASRDPVAIFIYCSLFPKNEEMKHAIKEFIESVLRGTLVSERNAKNSHGHYLTADQKTHFEQGSEIPLLKEGKTDILFEPRKFLEQRLVRDSHGTVELAEVLKEPDPVNPISKLFEEFSTLSEKSDQIRLLEQMLIALNAKPEYRSLQFMQDIRDQIQALKAPSKSSSDLKLVDSDNWEDLFLCGTDVLGSCQRVDGDPGLNCCLLGYVLDGKIRIFAIKNASGTIIARAIVKLLVTTRGEPVLFIERCYPDQMYAKEIKSLVKQKANLMGIPLYEHGPFQKRLCLKSESCVAPYEYEDAAAHVGVTNGRYLLECVKEVE